MAILQQFDLSGKTALVTGCNKGIGKAMALGLAEAGANIIGVSASLELAGSDIEKEVTAFGKTFKAYQADFSNRVHLYSFIKKSGTSSYGFIWVMSGENHAFTDMAPAPVPELK
jgi:2-deoxy-D-gluconate 3-dehydrogenase